MLFLGFIVPLYKQNKYKYMYIHDIVPKYMYIVKKDNYYF